MRTLAFAVADRICDDCSLALRRYLGGLQGVGTVDVDGRNVAVMYDENVVSGEKVRTLSLESLEKLGHRLAE